MNWIDKLMTTQAREPSGFFGQWVLPKIFDLSNLDQDKTTLQLLDIKDNLKLLDVGCGTGHLLQTLSTSVNSIDMTGIDNSKVMVSVAQIRHADSIRLGRVSIKKASWVNLEFADNTFDRINASNVVYFWERPLDILNNLYRITKKGGLIVISLRVDDSLDPRIMKQFGYNLYDDQSLSSLMINSKFTNVQLTDKTARNRNKTWRLLWVTGSK